LHKFPLLLYIGAGILAFTAGEMLTQDARVGLLLAYWLPQGHNLIPIFLTGAVILIGGMQTMGKR
ncbi:hypothetical protein, partial [Streptomyces sp. URMC 124]